MGQPRDLKLFESFHRLRGIVDMVHHFFNSTFLGNGEYARLASSRTISQKWWRFILRPFDESSSTDQPKPRKVRVNIDFFESIVESGRVGTISLDGLHYDA
jgi:hypothetical protein